MQFPLMFIPIGAHSQERYIRPMIILVQAQYLDKGHTARRATCTCTFIPGLSWDGLCIPGIPGYSDKGHTARRATCTCTFIPGLSWDCLLDKGHTARRATCTCTFIPGLSWDCLLDKGHAARRSTFILGLSRKFMNWWLLWHYCGMLEE